MHKSENMLEVETEMLWLTSLTTKRIGERKKMSPPPSGADPEIGNRWGCNNKENASEASLKGMPHKFKQVSYK